ncbi:hypothetical protein JZ751_028271 [Albula glossodonta]|uniref:Uncharacterized protein n=1 Tax=Albula glossodonta TaxID=121402 RepID=A0A8T2NJD9_9TELE|nr:hypothetical protein JZ751_028271 [Albula glossodonta]
MACASPSMMEMIERDEEEGGPGQPLIRQYQPTELIPAKRLPLHNLLQKQPGAMGVVQIVSGITSFGLGVVLAAKSTLTLTILFRVPILTGLLFFISGMLSSLMHKFSRLLPVCFAVNIGCLCVAGVGILFLIADLSLQSSQVESRMIGHVKALILCVTVLDVIITGILLFYLRKELLSTRKKS